jgi:hypothetical protein
MHQASAWPGGAPTLSSASAFFTCATYGLFSGRARGDDDRLLLALGLRDEAEILDALLLLGDGLLDRDAPADHVGDVLLLDLDFLLLGDRAERHLALTDDLLEGARLLDALGLDGDLALAALLRDRGAALLVLLRDEDLLLVLRAQDLRLLRLLVGDALRLLLLARLGGGDLLVRLRLGLGAALVEREHGLVALQRLAADVHALLLAELVRHDVLHGRDVGDLLDALRVEDVLRVHELERRLLEVVDGDVVEDEAVEVAADDLLDLVAEDLALLVEVLELELLADGLERLGELRGEEVLDRLLVGRARSADRLRDLEHVLHRLVHAHEERDLDVRADVVRADQALLPAPVDLDRLDGDVHDLRAVDDGPHREPGERHVRFAAAEPDAGLDQGSTLIDQAIEAREHRKEAQDEHHCG